MSEVNENGRILLVRLHPSVDSAGVARTKEQVEQFVQKYAPGIKVLVVSADEIIAVDGTADG